MKKTILVPLVALVICFTGIQVKASGNENLDKLKFEITAFDELNLGARYDRVWKITYNESKVPVTVIKHKTGNGYEFAVHSEFFEVCYYLNSTGFGAKELRNKHCRVPVEITRAVINSSEMGRQRIISPNKVDDEMAIGLIANFLPKLINPGYTHLIN